MCQHQDLRPELVRDYPVLEVPPDGVSAEVRAGEGQLEGIRGWILVFGLLDEPSAYDPLLAGRLALRYPVLGNTSRYIDGFDAGSGGALFIPWPSVDFSLRHIRMERHDVGKETERPSFPVARAVVSFVPVLIQDPAPPGLDSVTYGRELIHVTAEGSAVEVPQGATEYRVLPASKLRKGKRFTIVEKTGDIVWARYTIDPYEPMASAAALGNCAWKTTPLAPRPTIYLEHDDASERHATIYWRYDLGQIR